MTTIKFTDEETTKVAPGEEVVVVPAVTAPVDFAAKTAEALEDLRALAPAIQNLAERVGTELAPVYVRVVKGQISDEVAEAFSRRTGWEDLWSELSHLADQLAAAAATRPNISPVAWYDALPEGDRL